MKILAIETSCDETAAAVVEDGTTILSDVVASSADIQKRWGGIVPEVAARHQLSYMIPVLIEALQPFLTPHGGNYLKAIREEIDAIAVTVGPGLIGSLLIGIETAKTLSCVTGKPLIPVNHVLAHMYANFAGSPPPRIPFPAISLVVSGGHTELFLMTSARELRWLGGTIDDAAGEAFDKTARLLGFGGGGGPAIQEAAARARIGTADRFVTLPRPMLHSGDLSFSFSGLKTAVMREWKKTGTDNRHPTDQIQNMFAHEIQEAITEVLVAKTLRAASQYGARSVLVSGGVAANARLREKFMAEIKNLQSDISFHIPPVRLCTDNAVYIGSYAFFCGQPQNWQTVTVTPDLSVETRA